MIAKKYKISNGVGRSISRLVSFDKALIDAGVGNYNLVKLSSILPAGCEKVDSIDIPEGSLLPTAYSTITSDREGDVLVSSIGVGIPVDKSKVGVIMEHSTINKGVTVTTNELLEMIEEAFLYRGWELQCIEWTHATTIVEDSDVSVTTFACIAEW